MANEKGAGILMRSVRVFVAREKPVVRLEAPFCRQSVGQKQDGEDEGDDEKSAHDNPDNHRDGGGWGQRLAGARIDRLELLQRRGVLAQTVQARLGPRAAGLGQALFARGAQRRVARQTHGRAEILDARARQQIGLELGQPQRLLFGRLDRREDVRTESGAGHIGAGLLYGWGWCVGVGKNCRLFSTAQIHCGGDANSRDGKQRPGNVSVPVDLVDHVADLRERGGFEHGGGGHGNSRLGTGKDLRGVLEDWQAGIRHCRRGLTLCMRFAKQGFLRNTPNCFYFFVTSTSEIMATVRRMARKIRTSGNGPWTSGEL